MANEALLKRIRGLYHPKPLLDGWCSEEKALVYVELILGLRPAVAVEIGVMSGASLIPIAMAMAAVGGKVYGIDAWDREAAMEGILHEDNLRCWGEMDYDNKLDSCRFSLRTLKVTNCELIRARSVEAAKRFEDGQVGFLHVDGNHSAGPVLEDVKAWLPKMQPNGIIVMNATGWTEGRKHGPGSFTIRPAANHLLENGCETDNATGDYLVLRKTA